eukprot:m.12509 g.12509  ORF g.12509 m.12509 type:complete len:230 (-) comp6902_c0_seq1:99-788(-)
MPPKAEKPKGQNLGGKGSKALHRKRKPNKESPGSSPQAPTAESPPPAAAAAYPYEEHGAKRAPGEAQMLDVGFVDFNPPQGSTPTAAAAFVDLPQGPSPAAVAAAAATNNSVLPLYLNFPAGPMVAADPPQQQQQQGNLDQAAWDAANQTGNAGFFSTETFAAAGAASSSAAVTAAAATTFQLPSWALPNRFTTPPDEFARIVAERRRGRNQQALADLKAMAAGRFSYN